MYININMTTNIINIPTSKSPLSDYIKVYENVLSLDECQTILNEYQHSNDWKIALLQNMKEDISYRNCETINISLSNIINSNKDIRTKIDNMIFDKIGSIIKKYISDFPSCVLQADNGYNLLKYKTGCFYKQHTDSYTDMSRSISISINLNDDYVGGNMAFFDREIQIRSGAGSAIVFPSNFMYPHEIMPVEDGTRYSIVTWIS